MHLNFDTLAADVAVWSKTYADWIGEQHGEEAGRATAADLKAKPWQALQWYVEDHAPADQRA